LGKLKTNQIIDKKYFKTEQLCIYNLEYNTKLSSSIDDLIQYFLTFVIFVYLIHSNNEPLHKLKLITNDKQMFDKNLFGKTIDEKKFHIHFLKDLFVTKVNIMIEPNKNPYILITNKIEQLLVRDFLNNYMIENIKDTNNLECNITTLLEILQKSQNINGYFKHNKYLTYNTNFKKNKYTKKNIPKNFSYKTLNRIQKQYIHKTRKLCKNNKLINKNNDLKKTYYLYVFIKFIQLYLNTIQYKQTNYGDFYGSVPKEHIIQLFS
jgi:hypothetical protein